MKGKLLAAITALSLLLSSGCSMMLNRDYISVTTHNTTSPTTEGDPSTLRAESYQEVVNALIYFINQGVETGTIRLYMDSDDIEAELENACLEVVQEDALGAYAVDYMKYSVNSVVTYNQAEVQIFYRRTKEQIASIASVTGTTAIRNELRSALSTFQSEQVLRVSYFDGDSDSISKLVQQAYYSNPGTALGIPETEIHIYPENGRQRIVEILLTYPLTRQELEKRRELLELNLSNLHQIFSLSQKKDRFLSAAQTILMTGGYKPTGGNTAYDALLNGGADSEGLALAMAFFCQSLGLPCQVVSGEKAGHSHFWNAVETDSGWRHLDLTALDYSSPYFIDEEAVAQGYSWDNTSIPKCS